MKVILLSELRGKGGEGDIVEVAQGYAENYLFPKRLAIQATPCNIKQLEERRHNIAKREEQRIADGQLFGSVTSAMIADAIKEQLDIEIDRRRVERNANIKTAGIHEVTVNLYREISAAVTVSVGDGSEPEVEEPQAEAEVEAEETAPEAEEAAE